MVTGKQVYSTTIKFKACIVTTLENLRFNKDLLPKSATLKNGVTYEL